MDLNKLLCARKEFIVEEQILRSGTSIRANVSEAVHAQSRRDFTAKLSISRKEANETMYWLRLLKESGILEQERATELMQDCDEIQKILSSIIISIKRNGLNSPRQY